MQFCTRVELSILVENFKINGKYSVRAVRDLQLEVEKKLQKMSDLGGRVDARGARARVARAEIDVGEDRFARADAEVKLSYSNVFSIALDLRGHPFAQSATIRAKKKNAWKNMNRWLGEMQATLQ